MESKAEAKDISVGVEDLTKGAKRLRHADAPQASEKEIAPVGAHRILRALQHGVSVPGTRPCKKKHVQGRKGSVGSENSRETEHPDQRLSWP